MNTPTLRVERGLLGDGVSLVAGMDEVGRGALAGPVSVGVVVVDETTRDAPEGVDDSKRLTAKARQRLAPELAAWPVAAAVGHASPQEIDAFGIIAALQLAGWRALEAAEAQAEREIDLVILDGSHDWLSAPADLFDQPVGPTVQMMVKADQHCASVAAASVLAKVERDNLMTKLDADFPAFGWRGNKGYASAGHVEALKLHGPVEHHRRSWKLPGVCQRFSTGL